MFSEVQCDRVENRKGGEISMKGFAIKVSTSEMTSLKKRGKKTAGVKKNSWQEVAGKKF